MKKALLLFCIIGLSHAAFSQYSLTFCKNVNSQGRAENAASSFTSNSSGNTLKLLLKTDDKFTGSGVEYRIFYVDGSGKEAELSKLPQSLEPGWDFAWKEVVIYDPGTYRVKIFDEKGIYLTSANVSIRN